MASMKLVELFIFIAFEYEVVAGGAIRMHYCHQKIAY